MSYIETKRNINNGIISPLYLIVGTEAFIEKDLVHLITNKVLDEDQLEFNLSVFDMKETPIDVAVEEAMTLPFFGDKRVVVIKDAYFLTGQKDDGKVEHNLDSLIEYATNPVSETVMVISVPYEKLDERKKICKVLRKESTVVDAKSFTEKEMFEWLDEQCRSQNVQITNSAKERIVTLVGPNLLLLVNELQKLAIHVGEKGTIDESTVEELVAKTIEQDIFVLINFIMNKNIASALELFDELLKQKEEPIKIIALIARQVRNLYQVRQLHEFGFSQKQIAGQLKLHPYVVKLSLEQAKKYSNQQLLTLLSLLAEADYEIKSGQKDKRLALELIFMKFK